MQYTEKTPDHVLDALHNPICVACGGTGEIDYLPDGYRGSIANNPHANYTWCRACGGSGHQMDAWERVENG